MAGRPGSAAQPTYETPSCTKSTRSKARPTFAFPGKGNGKATRKPSTTHQSPLSEALFSEFVETSDPPCWSHV